MALEEQETNEARLMMPGASGPHLSIPVKIVGLVTSGESSGVVRRLNMEIIQEALGR